MLGAEHKRCNQCGRDLPIESFHLDVGSDDGRRNVCAGCRKLLSQAEKEATVDETFRALQELGIQQLKTISLGGSRVPHAAEVYEAIMSGFGGPQLFGMQVAALYHHPSSSPAVKAKIAQAVISLSRAVSDSGAIARDLDSYSTDDLERLVRDRYRQAIDDKWQELRVAPETRELMIPGFVESKEAGDVQQRVG